MTRSGKTTGNNASGPRSSNARLRDSLRIPRLSVLSVALVLAVAAAAQAHAGSLDGGNTGAQVTSVAYGPGATTNGKQNSMAVGNGAQASDDFDTAIGASAVTMGIGASAFGYLAKAAAANATALGYSAQATGTASTALGFSAQAKSGGDTAIGQSALASGGNSVAIGTSTSATGASAIAQGNLANASGQTSVALGYNTTASGASGVALGRDAKAYGNYSIALGGATAGVSGGSSPAYDVAIGTNATATGGSSIATGVASTATGAASIAMGRGAYATGQNGIAIGGASTNPLAAHYGAAASGQDGIALGRGAQAAGTGSIAIGSGSALLSDGRTLDPSTLSSASAQDSVSIGRTAQATAVNSLALGAGSRTTADLSAAAYAPYGDTTLAGLTPTGEASVGSAAAQRRVTNVAAGSAPTDAVNVSQLQATDSHVATLDTRVSGAENNIADLTQRLDTGSVGLVLQDSATGDLTIGKSTGGTRLDITGTNGSRTLTGVSAGSIGMGSTDAVNGGQLFTTSNNVADSLGGGAAVSANGAWRLPTFLIDGQSFSNVSDALTNLDQRTSANTVALTGIGTTVSNIQSKPPTPQEDVTGLQARIASLESSMAASPGSVTTAVPGLKINGVDAGSTTSATGSNGVALGQGATASAANSVALGAGSVANRDNVVSVGAAGNERVVANVADAVQDTDAVNKRSLDLVSQGAAQYTDQRVGQMQNAIGTTAREAYSGVAAATAMAMLPDIDSGKSLSIGVSGAQYKGYAASAVGVTARVRQNVKIRLGVGMGSGGNTYGAGAAYQW